MVSLVRQMKILKPTGLVVLLLTFVCQISQAFADEASQPAGSLVFRDTVKGFLADFSNDTLPVLQDWKQDFSAERTEITKNDTSIREQESRVNISGVKSFGVSVDDAGQTGIQQKLRLRLQGSPAPGVFLEGVLSDQGSANRAEFQTSSLRELEEVWLYLYSDLWSVRLGDIPWTWDQTTLGKLEAEGTGVDVRVQKNSHAGRVSWSVPRARWQRLQFNGRSGQQKGYAADASSGIGSWVEGSWSVWRNGVLLQEHRDYEIDPVQGTIDFTARHLVTDRDVYTLQFQVLDDLRGREDLGWRLQTGSDWILGWEGKTRMVDLEVLRNEGLLAAETDSLQNANGADLPEAVHQSVLNFGWNNNHWNLNSELALMSKDSNVLAENTNEVVSAAAIWEAGYSTEQGKNTWSASYNGEWYDSLYAGWEPRSEGYAFWQKWSLDTLAMQGGSMIDEMLLQWQHQNGMSASADAGYIRGVSAKELQPYNSWRGRGRLSWLGSEAGAKMQLSRNHVWQDSAFARELGEALLYAGPPVFQPFVVWESERWWFNQGAANGSGDRRWLRPELGVQWRPLELQGRSSVWREYWQVRQNQNHRDSIRVLQTGHSVEWMQIGSWDGQLDFQFRDVEYLMKPAQQNEQFWTLATRQGWGRPARGVRLDGNYALGAGSYQLLEAVYRTVPQGAGDFRYDSLARQYVEDEDRGNLIFEGMVPVEDQDPVLTGEAEIQLDAELHPGKWGVQSGILRDLRLRFNGSWQTRDSARGWVWLPAFDQTKLKDSWEGEQQTGLRLFWELPDRRWDAQIWKQDYSRIRPGTLSEWIDESQYGLELGHHPFEMLRLVVSGELGEFTREASLNSQYDIQMLEARQEWETDGGWRWIPGLRRRTGSGLWLDADFSVLMREAFLRTEKRWKEWGNWSAEYRLVQVQQNQDNLFLYGVTQGYAPGYSHRVSLTALFDQVERVQGLLRYVMRLDQLDPSGYHTLQGEVRVVF